MTISSVVGFFGNLITDVGNIVGDVKNNLNDPSTLVQDISQDGTKLVSDGSEATTIFPNFWNNLVNTTTSTADTVGHDFSDAFSNWKNPSVAIGDVFSAFGSIVKGFESIF